MSTIRSTANAEHYIWGKVCDGWHLVRTPELSIIQETMPPGAAEARHLHERARQFFYVLDGELTLEVAGEELRLKPEEGLEIAPGTPHQALNRSADPVRFMVTSQPPSHGDRVLA
ncbi:Mannose-6-phosphate isomerase, cupin superfamily [Granulicella rosea]|uniref:Mannose-6-phosphate isomerase, cupin superfamily n=1 Tax=Granulicella rosea TaxID=474952 RepID=A0A239LQS3_9BACT|nr:cupin domain-containing protein [Granulicella rosea]SNT32640.1 Mannose-6-phosphate isomerase, cupin superfamily [Granulicella rosea]